jgi:hypothetical protein
MIKRDGQISELYLGRGWAIGETNIFLEADAGSRVNAVLIRAAGGWKSTASAPVRAGMVFALPAPGSKATHWRLMRTAALERQGIPSAEIRMIPNGAGGGFLAVRCELPTGEDIQLSVEAATR